MEAVISTSQAQFGDQFIHVGPSGWIWVNFRDASPFILLWLMHCCIFFGVYKIIMVEQCGHPSSWLGGSIFKRGQLFVSHVLNSSPHFVRKCPFYPWQLVSIYINGALGKEQLLGSHPAASQPCINWTEQPSDSLRKQPTFFNTTTGFPVKWRLRNDYRNFILLRCQYLVLGSASKWSWVKGKLQSEALLRSG